MRAVHAHVKVWPGTAEVQVALAADLNNIGCFVCAGTQSRAFKLSSTDISGRTSTAISNLIGTVCTAWQAGPAGSATRRASVLNLLLTLKTHAHSARSHTHRSPYLMPNHVLEQALARLFALAAGRCSKMGLARPRGGVAGGISALVVTDRLWRCGWQDVPALIALDYVQTQAHTHVRRA